MRFLFVLAVIQNIFTQATVIDTENQPVHHNNKKLNSKQYKYHCVHKPYSTSYEANKVTTHVNQDAQHGIDKNQIYDKVAKYHCTKELIDLDAKKERREILAYISFGILAALILFYGG